MERALPVVGIPWIVFSIVVIVFTLIEEDVAPLVWMLLFPMRIVIALTHVPCVYHEHGLISEKLQFGSDVYLFAHTFHVFVLC